MLFKYLNSKWMDEFFSTGSLKLGTVRAYNDTIALGTARGDDRDGKKSVAQYVEYLKTGDKDDHLLRQFFNARNAEIVVEHSTLNTHYIGPDALAFCTSYAYSDDLLRRYASEFHDVDACYAIEDPFSFFNAIKSAIRTRYETLRIGSPIFGPNRTDYPHPYSPLNPIKAAFRARFEMLRLGYCLYGPDPLPHDHAHAEAPILLVKRESYAWQREVRAIWEPRLVPYSNPLTPIFPLVPEARKYARPFASLRPDGAIERM